MKKICFNSGDIDAKVVAPAKEKSIVVGADEDVGWLSSRKMPMSALSGPLYPEMPFSSPRLKPLSPSAAGPAARQCC